MSAGGSRELVERVAATVVRKADTRAVTFRQAYGTASRPVVLRCADGNEWVVKGAQSGKTPVNEQVVCFLGAGIGAPVVETALVYVPQELIAAVPEMSHMQPGVAHGSRLLMGCMDARALRFFNDENRSRYAALHVLYSWADSNDEQVLYQMGSPVLVYSHDHGHFFPGGPDWSVDSLDAGMRPHLKPFFSFCGLEVADYADALAKLERVAPEDIAMAVCHSPLGWACTIDERVALADYLGERVPAVIALFRGR